MNKRSLVAAAFAALLTLGLVACEEAADNGLDDPLEDDPIEEENDL